jgi:Uma2 family endonuclease
MRVFKKPFSAEAFDTYIQQPANNQRLFELVNGELLEKMPSSAFVSNIAGIIIFWLRLFLRDGGIQGYVTGEAGGYYVAGERYAPDVAYLSKAKQPLLARDGYNPVAPELAVEIESHTTAESERRLRAKVLRYLEAGVLLWVVYADERQVEVYAPGQPMRTLGIDDTLDGGAVLPGFTLPVATLFADDE